MALYAIGDLHLSFQVELKNESQRNGKIWKNHEVYFKENCEKLVKPEDTLVLVGDHSWGRNLDECQEDLAYIEALPGRKILIRGNHDMAWPAKKTQKLNDMFQGKLFFLQNNFATYNDYALVGTKGYCFEGLDTWEHSEKIVQREAERLEVSFEAAKAAGYERFIMFLHYPPTNILEKNSVFTKMAEKYGAEQVVYAHCHGEARFHDSIRGRKHGIEYSLVSGDFLRWHPKKILD